MNQGHGQRLIEDGINTEVPNEDNPGEDRSIEECPDSDIEVAAIAAQRPHV
jgi:hypothetical protein